MEFDISAILTGIVAYIDVIVGGNEFAAGAIIAGLMGILTYMSRAVPASIWIQVVKHTTTSLELNSTNDSYHYLAKYLHRNGFTNQSRFIKIGNGRWGDEKNVKQVGYGKQVFWLNWYTPILVVSHKEDSQSSQVKEFITLKKLGRSHVLFNKMIESIEKANENPDMTKFYSFKEGYQHYITSQDKRRMDTIVIPKKSLDKLYASIDAFVEREDWYLKHQIPYQLGILLFGPPGTGKTSLIRAIAAYMGKDVCYIDSETSLSAAATTVNDTMLVVEEVDTFCLNKRENENIEDGGEVDEIAEMVRSFDKKILGKVLNALDGIISNHGRVIIMTTNYVETLDPALVRPGRIDIQIEVGYLCSETFNALLKRFFPDYEEKEVVMKKEISPVMIQNDIILGLTPDEIIEKYTEAGTENYLLDFENVA